MTSRRAQLTNSERSQYKDTNADVIGWVVERASERSLRSLIAEIVDAAGLEGAFHITTDREGVPGVDGGARYRTIFCPYFSLLCAAVAAFWVKLWEVRHSSNARCARACPCHYPTNIRYSNHTMVCGRSLGHGGWGGQYALANLDRGMVGIFFSVIENQHAINADYLPPVIRMLESITSLAFERGSLPDRPSASGKSPATSGSSASCTTIWASLTTNVTASNVPLTPSVLKCQRCPRYKSSAM